MGKCKQAGWPCRQSHLSGEAAHLNETAPSLPYHQWEVLFLTLPLNTLLHYFITKINLASGNLPLLLWVHSDSRRSANGLERLNQMQNLEIEEILRGDQDNQR